MVALEVLLILVVIIIAALIIAARINRIARENERARRIQECIASLNMITAHLVHYQVNPSAQQCQAINIMIDAWNGRCNEFPGFQQLPRLKCP